MVNLNINFGPQNKTNLSLEVCLQTSCSLFLELYKM